MSVKSDCFTNAQPLHNDEAGGVAERVRLVFVSADEGARFPFILRRKTLNDTESALDTIEERKSIRPTVASAIQQ